MSNQDEIINAFRRVKAEGFVKSHRLNNTGIGKTFEDRMNVDENNIQGPDLLGFEIKSHREDSSSYVTMFTLSPSNKNANTTLKNTYGSPYDDFPDVYNLHTSMFANCFNSYKGKYSFRLINDRENKRLKIGVFNIGTKELIDNSNYYDYSKIERAFLRKLKNLFYVSADREHRTDGEYFYFKKADIYTEPTFDKFLDLIDSGVIMFDIRIGSYKSGPKKNQPHDYGNGFRIKESDLKLLYANHIEVE